MNSTCQLPVVLVWQLGKTRGGEICRKWALNPLIFPLDVWRTCGHAAGAATRSAAGPIAFRRGGKSSHHYVEHERNLPPRAKNPHASAFHLQSEAPTDLRGESPRLFLKAQLACRASVLLRTLFFFFFPPSGRDEIRAAAARPLPPHNWSRARSPSTRPRRATDGGIDSARRCWWGRIYPGLLFLFVLFFC